MTLRLQPIIFQEKPILNLGQECWCQFESHFLVGQSRDWRFQNPYMVLEVRDFKILIWLLAEVSTGSANPNLIPVGH